MTTGDIITIRASVNKWMMDNFEGHRKYLNHLQPVHDAENGLWYIKVTTKGINGHSVPLGEITLDSDGKVVSGDHLAISKKIDELLLQYPSESSFEGNIKGDNHSFFFGDGLQVAKSLKDKSVDLLLTDPPYGISKPYVCENQIPRRLRPNGRDFIMPKGHFGDWDSEINPSKWVNVVLPKVKGWFVTFCAHDQIGIYQNILREHNFSAVGTIVWQKTNPVPFNAKYKPVNAWEAIVVGKRPGTKFNGKGVVHNVFKHKSPSPQTRVHSTQKPIGLLNQFVDLFSVVGDVVFDPFAGSGSTVISAAQKGRFGIGCEADQANYQAACRYITESLNES